MLGRWKCTGHHHDIAHTHIEETLDLAAAYACKHHQHCSHLHTIANLITATIGVDQKRFPTQCGSSYTHVHSHVIIQAISEYLTIAIIINAVVGDLSSVHPHIGCQVWVVSLNARVDDTDRHTGAAQGLLVPVTRRLHQIQVIQAVPIGCVSILDADLVVQRCIGNICITTAVSADILRP